MIFVDASAFVSIIAGETDADDLSDRLEQWETRFCSAISIWETIAAIARTHQASVSGARELVEHYRAETGLQYVAIGEQEAVLATLAYEKFGKGRHKAALNMGDCFAYACAKANNAKLLFKGEDFPLTDIERA